MDSSTASETIAAPWSALMARRMSPCATYAIASIAPSVTVSRSASAIRRTSSPIAACVSGRKR